jgi:hypothetical protein
MAAHADDAASSSDSQLRPPSSLKGRHIKVARVGYTHHGIISADDGDRVIHYAKGDGPAGALSGVIREESFARFLGGSAAADVSFVDEDEVEPKFTRAEVEARARHCIGLADYSLWGANCEHWAYWCQTGHSHSRQVHDSGKLCTTIGVIAGVVSFVGITVGAILMRSSGAHTRRNPQ